MRKLITGALMGVALADLSSEPDGLGLVEVTQAVENAEFDSSLGDDTMLGQVVLDMTNLQQLKQMGRSTFANGTDIDEALDGLHRYVDLKKLISWLQPVDKRISRFCFYGCWCLPEGANRFVAGTGKPVDLLDRACYQQWQCYECAKAAFDKNGYICDPTKRKYARKFFYSLSSPNDYSQRGITCTNPFRKPNTGQNQKINCARAVCECDKFLAMRLSKYHTFWSKSRHRIWSQSMPNPFIYADECVYCVGASCGGFAGDHEKFCCGDFTAGTRMPVRDHGGVFECCNHGPNGGFAWYGVMFNTLTNCCLQGSISHSFSCVAPSSGSGQMGLDCDEAVMDIVFMLDESGSVGGSNFDKNVDFVADLMASFDMSDLKTRVAGVRFSSTVAVEFDFMGDKLAAIRKFEAILYNGGGTKINTALQGVADALGNGGLSFRTNVKTVVIIMTDGSSTDGVNPGANNLRAAKGAGEPDVIILSLGIGNGILQSELDIIATDPDSKYSHNVSGYGNLQDVKDAIGDALCT